MNEEEMIRAICAGGNNQELAFRAIYNIKAAAFRAYFMSRGLSRELAEDLVQDTIVKIFGGANNYTGGAGFGNASANAWMWTIARNCMRDHYRAAGSDIDIPLDDEVLDGDREGVGIEWELAVKNPLNPSEQSVSDCVVHGLNKFAEVHPNRACALEMQMDDESITSIAQRIGRTYVATKEYLSQCRRHLEPYIKHCTPLLKQRMGYE